MVAQEPSNRNNPQAHHVVPKSYLVRFSDPDGFLHAYDRKENKRLRQRPENLMHRRYYYRQEWAQEGVDPNILEKRLGEWLEASAKNTIDQLLTESPQVTEEQLADFLLFLEIQRTRVPRQSEMATILMREAILGLAPPDLAAAVSAGKIQLTMNKSARFDYMRTMLKQLTPWFAHMEWEIVTAEAGSSFVTTDSPVSLFNVACRPPAEPGIALAGTKVLFPLTSDHLLILQHPSYLRSGHPLEVLPDPDPGEINDRVLRIDRGRVWDKKTVTRHNYVMFCLAERLIVCNSPDLLEECIYLEPQPTAPIQ